MKFEKTAKALDLLLTRSGYEYAAHFMSMELTITRPSGMDAQIDMLEADTLDSAEARIVIQHRPDGTTATVYGRATIDAALLTKIIRTWEKVCVAWMYANHFKLFGDEIVLTQTGTPEPTEEEA